MNRQPTWYTLDVSLSSIITTLFSPFDIQTHVLSPVSTFSNQRWLLCPLLNGKCVQQVFLAFLALWLLRCYAIFDIEFTWEMKMKAV